MKRFSPADQYFSEVNQSDFSTKFFVRSVFTYFGEACLYVKCVQGKLDSAGNYKKALIQFFFIYCLKTKFWGIMAKFS